MLDADLWQYEDSGLWHLSSDLCFLSTDLWRLESEICHPKADHKPGTTCNMQQKNRIEYFVDIGIKYEESVERHQGGNA